VKVIGYEYEEVLEGFKRCLWRLMNGFLWVSVWGGEFL
jgi:hypothetical protein